MCDTDQLSELLELWNCLNNGQREGLLRLLRAIIEESQDPDADILDALKSGVGPGSY